MIEGLSIIIGLILIPALIALLLDLWDKMVVKKKVSKGIKMVEREPKKFDAYYVRAQGYMEDGQYDKAISDFNSALEINPKSKEAHGLRGECYYRKGEYEQAISDFKDALEIDMKYSFAYINRGRVYRKIGEYQKSISDFDTAFTIEPHVQVYYEKAFTYEKAGQINEAIDNYKKYLKHTPSGIIETFRRKDARWKIIELKEKLRNISNYGEKIISDEKVEKKKGQEIQSNNTDDSRVGWKVTIGLISGFIFGVFCLRFYNIYLLDFIIGFVGEKVAMALNIIVFLMALIGSPLLVGALVGGIGVSNIWKFMRFLLSKERFFSLFLAYGF